MYYIRYQKIVKSILTNEVEVHIDSQLIALYLANECTPEEKQLIEQQMMFDPELAKTIKKLKISTKIKEQPSRPINTNASWQQLQQRIVLETAKSFYKSPEFKSTIQHKHKHKHKHKRSLQLLRYAAVIIFAVTLSYFYFGGNLNLPWQQQAFTEAYETLKINNGERQNITLPDGSLVTVDAGSEIKYFTKYENERHVYLKGEACFNVAHDATRPFFVHAEQAIVRVVGTRFNVRSWQINPDVVITVAEGKVLVSRSDSTQEDDNTVMLTKDQQGTVPLTGPLTHLDHIDADRYFGWMQNEIHFVDSKVSEVVSQLERWYDYKFVFRDPNALEQLISVHIRGANVEEVIRVISVVTSTKVSRNGKLVEFFQEL